MIETARRSESGSRRSLGDAVRAYFALQPADLIAEGRLAGMLGFGLREQAAATAGEGEASIPRHERGSEHEASPSAQRADAEGVPEDEMMPEPAVPQSIAPELPAPGEPPPMASEHPFRLRFRRGSAPPRSRRLSLFSPDRQRALLSGLLARRSRTGPVDIEAVVARVARGEAIVDVPRRLHWSIRRSIDVLVDMGEGMQPFRRDQFQLIGALRRILGAHRLRVGTYRDFPQSGVRLAGRQHRDYLPIPGGSIVLLAAPGEDLSLDPRSSIALWQSFLEQIKAAGGEATVLSPLASATQEPGLARVAAIVPWDRRTGMTTVRDVRRARARR
jgi:hypothetical protein